ncbi:hypothetical protein Q5P01_017853 [Channa striata]|uniref:Uncharacterized protein n=1 Tax=Channa striata TaxID=64152 RepID=A0AA88MA29_CHASR|nr:hypothetical protein Q5P01_017853 [Channa striata]
MTSSVFSILFTIFLVSSVNANGSEVQIKEGDIDALNDISAEPVPAEYSNKKWIISHVTADQVDFHVQANSALKIDMKNFGIVSATEDPKASAIEVNGLTVKVELDLKSADGKLSFSWKSCTMSADKAKLKSPGIIGKLKNIGVQVVRPFLKYVVCFL